jgi:hypothetical protein
MSDIPIPIDTGDFRLMGRNVLDVLLAMPEQNRFIRGMVSWAGFRQVAIPYERAAREKGVTKYTLWKMLDFALDAITGFSAFPLRLSIAFSLIFFLAAGLVLIYALFSFFFLKVVSGWTSITMLITLFSAVQLFCMGIIGEYVHRDKTAAALRHPGSEVLAGRVGCRRYDRVGGLALRPVIAGHGGAALCLCRAARARWLSVRSIFFSYFPKVWWLAVQGAKSTEPLRPVRARMANKVERIRVYKP